MALAKLKQLFEGNYFSGYVPKEWLRMRLIFLSKPRNTDYSSASSFIPICLALFVFKCMELSVY